MNQTKNILVIFLLFIFGSTKGQIITTIAGIDSMGFSGDGGPAINATLGVSWRISLDTAENVYFSDWGNNRIRKINGAGIITTVAGNGMAYGGDGGPATDAGLSQPFGIAVDNLGNLYITDQGIALYSSFIRKVDVLGTITTIAGGSLGYSGDGGSATAAQFQVITDLATDGLGNIFIVDAGNARIRKIDASGIVTTIAGNGTAGYSGDGGAATAAELNDPEAIAVDVAGNLYIADNGNVRIRKVSSSGIITTIAGTGTMGYSGDGGPATAAFFISIYGITIDAAGNIYISDELNNRIRKIDASGIITTIAGNGLTGHTGDGGSATAAGLDEPFGVSKDVTGNIYIVDERSFCIRKVAAYNDGVTSPRLSPDEQELLRIWPEPNEGTFTINISSATSEPAEIIVTNIIGQKIKELATATNKDTEVKLDALPGIYFVTAITGQGRQSTKILIE